MRKRFSFWKVFPAVAVLALTLSLSFVLISQPSASGVSLNHKLTNISDTAFAISWTTEFPCKAYIEYGKTPSLGDKAHDDRGEGTISGLHHIWIIDLIPETTCYYDVICNGIRYDNGGKHFSVTTGPSIYPKPPKTIIGQVLKADGLTPVEEAIVYVQVADCDGKGTPGQSQEWSRLVYADGYWAVTFGSLRTADLQSWFEFDESGGDSVLLTFEGGTEGKATLEVPAVIGNGFRLLPEVQLCTAS